MERHTPDSAPYHKPGGVDNEINSATLYNIDLLHDQTANLQAGINKADKEVSVTLSDNKFQFDSRLPAKQLNPLHLRVSDDRQDYRAIPCTELDKPPGNDEAVSMSDSQLPDTQVGGFDIQSVLRPSKQNSLQKNPPMSTLSDSRNDQEFQCLENTSSMTGRSTMAFDQPVFSDIALPDTQILDMVVVEDQKMIDTTTSALVLESQTPKMASLMTRHFQASKPCTDHYTSPRDETLQHFVTASRLSLDTALPDKQPCSSNLSTGSEVLVLQDSRPSMHTVKSALDSNSDFNDERIPEFLSTKIEERVDDTERLAADEPLEPCSLDQNTTWSTSVPLLTVSENHSSPYDIQASSNLQAPSSIQNDDHVPESLSKKQQVTSSSIDKTSTLLESTQSFISTSSEVRPPLNKVSCKERKRITVSSNRPPRVTKALIDWVTSTNWLLDPFREDDDCWFHPSPPPARLSVSGVLRPVGKLQKRFAWKDNDGKHSIVLNYGIAVKLVNFQMTRQQKDGFVNKQWHLSHLCGNWTCVNPAHTTVEPGTVNINRNNCFSHRSGCLHTPKCIKDKKVALGANGKLVDHSDHGGREIVDAHQLDDYLSPLLLDEDDFIMNDYEGSDTEMPDDMDVAKSPLVRPNGDIKNEVLGMRITSKVHIQGYGMI